MGQGPWKAVKGPKTGPSKDPGGGPDRGRPREPVEGASPGPQGAGPAVTGLLRTPEDL